AERCPLAAQRGQNAKASPSAQPPFGSAGPRQPPAGRSKILLPEGRTLWAERPTPAGAESWTPSATGPSPRRAWMRYRRAFIVVTKIRLLGGGPAARMLAGRWKVLPVVAENGRLVGAVERADPLRALLPPKGRRRREAEALAVIARG